MITGHLSPGRADSLYGARYGMFYDEDNTDAFVVDTADEWISYHSNGIASHHLGGWTFDAGGAGTSHAISSIADAGGGDITVTTATSHTLAVGAVVSHDGTADAAYQGVFVVLTVPSVTTYTVTAVYTATDTGVMNEAACLKAGPNCAGFYQISWSASGTPANANQNFDFGTYVNATKVVGGEMRRKFGTAGDFGSYSSTVIEEIADGDKVSFAVKNLTSAGNFTQRYFSLMIHRI